MPSRRQQLPASWQGYGTDGRQSSQDSGLSSNQVQFDEESQQHPEDGRLSLPPQGPLSMRRRSSVVDRMRQAGGVNSFDNFARSWQRAAGFYEVTPMRQSFRYADGKEGEDEEDQPQYGATPKGQRSLLRAALENEETRHQSVFEDEDDVATPLAEASPEVREQQPLLHERASKAHEDNIFSIEPSLASPFGGSYGSTWGSLSSRVNEPSMRHAGRLFRQQQMKGTSEPDKEREPLLVKQIQEDDGKVVNVVVGQSTLPQTIFNSVNVLIGVGILALPLAFKMSGWIPGLIFFAFAGISTSYTAKLLAKCADVDGSLITFADLAYVSFGPWARIGTSILFSLELIAACVALVVLFADSLDALIPGWGDVEWKVVCGIILIPLGFVPLRFLSFTSVLGILSCLGIVLAIFVDGLIKPHAPGSVREPALTHLFPENWMTLPIALGILMSPWGGHSVFPNIYRDMRHPYKYRRGVNITYSFTFSLDLFMAVVGYLMYGAGVKDEITRNVLTTPGYPDAINVLIVVCVAIIPLTKVPLNARPIVSTLELFLGLDARALADSSALTGLSGYTRGILKVVLRIGITILFVILAILVPQFDTIMSLLGAVACFTICIILPCAFHLKLFGHEIPRAQKALDWGLIVVSTALAVVSTAFNFVPIAQAGM
ncbi:vacuolar amino acid transporter-like protein 1 [Hortaea werneckii]|nr:vacuolar amino acid transporter-like protein 1 [Hortaea werneckii]KAI7096841.1 vacuolar amino acid transporter-like protein 1 [Hortaea werneckii]KAI7230569.1 vacuolar amino acid transporter-like protein 1 [Hortaea werneckii]KAI7315716.1 vacuolar amino acid transporter-like protein 1 [Hortaea werneckii]KAI7377513.1 vacuolar amino acid transporter-like protein 1 [Hortaea werneckii]